MAHRAALELGSDERSSPREGQCQAYPITCRGGDQHAESVRRCRYVVSVRCHWRRVWRGVGVLYGLFPAIIGALNVKDVTLFDSLLPVAILYGALIGFPSGFISGVLGGCLGGPLGCAVGGMIGTGLLALPLYQGGKGFSSPPPFALFPSVWGAAFGCVIGSHIRRRVPLFPGVEWLAESIYSSPLGEWLGWRHRTVK
jgi:hypothetical protein